MDFTIGDKRGNGIRMGEGEFVYAHLPNDVREYLGTIRIDDDGTPYLNYELGIFSSLPFPVRRTENA
jgi:hypothetical protein